MFSTIWRQNEIKAKSKPRFCAWAPASREGDSEVVILSQPPFLKWKTGMRETAASLNYHAF